MLVANPVPTGFTTDTLTSFIEYGSVGRVEGDEVSVDMAVLGIASQF